MVGYAPPECRFHGGNRSSFKLKPLKALKALSGIVQEKEDYSVIINVSGNNVICCHITHKFYKTFKSGILVFSVFIVTS